MNAIANNKLKQEILDIMIKEEIIKINFEKLFIFSSGIKSPIYLDCRLFFSNSFAFNLLINTIYKYITSNFNKNDYDAICGIVTSGLPIASVLAYKLKKPLIYIRPKVKDHGTNQQIEGKCFENMKVIYIEDLITTGKSVLNAIEVGLNEKIIPIKVISIFNYSVTTLFNDYNNEFITSILYFNDLKKYIDSNKLTDNILLLNEFYNKLKK